MGRLINLIAKQDNLIDNTQWTAKNELEKTRITHDEFKPFVEEDKANLEDPA